MQSLLGKCHTFIIIIIIILECVVRLFLKVCLRKAVKEVAVHIFRDVRMIIEGQGLKVRKGQYVHAHSKHYISVSGLNKTMCRLI